MTPFIMSIVLSAFSVGFGYALAHARSHARFHERLRIGEQRQAENRALVLAAQRVLLNVPMDPTLHRGLHTALEPFQGYED